MDDKSYQFRIPKRWARVALIVVTTALIVAPLTAIASHSFTDVPDTNTFHSDIAWLADAGVTKGCNPPANTEFCPNDNVSRGQMSAFLRRLSENKVVDAATAVNADSATTAASADNATTFDGDPKSDFQQWGDTLPPGDSLTGAWVVNGDPGFPGDNITFSTPLPGDIPNSDTHFLDVGDPFTADCPGPGQAAPGHLCVYAAEKTGSILFHCLCDPELGATNIAQSYGTALFMNASAVGQWAFGSWAVTSTSGMTQLSTSASSGGDSGTPGG